MLLRNLPAFLLCLTAAVASSATTGQAGEPVALFDGKTLQGWDVITCEAVVQDGAILLKSGNGLVQAKQQYGDFVLELEWKALKPDGWDSGIYFRYDEVPEGRPWPRRYQVNLRKGMEGNLDGRNGAKNPVPTVAGEWNHFELTVKGKNASLKVNGKQAWRVESIESPRGFLAIQAEVPGGGQFLFRNICIRELAD
jgi:hypothetical protein